MTKEKPYAAVLVVEGWDGWRIQTYEPGLNEQDGVTICHFPACSGNQEAKSDVLLVAKALARGVSVKTLARGKGEQP